MIEPYFLSSLIVVLMAMASMRFFWPLVRGMERSFEKYMVASVMWMGGATLARTLYWDMLQGVLAREHWIAVRDMLGQQDFSIVFNAAFVVALYYALQAARYLIPEAERPFWPWWRIWSYPAGTCLERWSKARGSRK